MKKTMCMKALGFLAVLLVVLAGSTNKVSAASTPIPVIPFAAETIGVGGTKDWTVSISNTSVNPVVDIMYVIDTTGSMYGALPIAAASLNAYSQSLIDAGATDIHFGAAFFGDWGCDDPWFGIDLPLGDHDIDDVKAAILGLTHTGGGDEPEDAVMAYMEVINQTPWRPEAQHVIVLITDATTKIRFPNDEGADMTVGGFDVDYAGAAALATAKNIHQTIIASYSRSVVSDFATALGVTEHSWTTQAELQAVLETIIEPVTDTYECEAIIDSITYASDGAVSTDVTVGITVGGAATSMFRLDPEDTNVFNFSAVGSSSPARYNDPTVVIIGFYIDGVRVGSQTLTYDPGDDPGTGGTTTTNTNTKVPSTGDNSQIYLYVVLAVSALITGVICLPKKSKSEQ